MAKAKIYKEENADPSADLILQLHDAVEQLAETSKASIPIYKGGQVAGYGINKAQRNIAADAVISVARAIKGLGGW